METDDTWFRPRQKIVLNEIAKQKLDNVEIIPFMAREEALKRFFRQMFLYFRV